MFEKFCKLMLRISNARKYFETHKNIKQEVLDKMFELVDQVDEVYAQLSEDEKTSAIRMIVGTFG